MPPAGPTPSDGYRVVKHDSEHAAFRRPYDTTGRHISDGGDNPYVTKHDPPGCGNEKIDYPGTKYDPKPMPQPTVGKSDPYRGQMPFKDKPRHMYE